MRNGQANLQGRHWIGTLSRAIVSNTWDPYVVYAGVADVTEFRGQDEIGAGGFAHVQCVISFSKPKRRSWLVANVAIGHWELTRSDAARAYVHKVIWCARTIYRSICHANTSTRQIQEWLEPSSATERLLYAGIQRQTGKALDAMLELGNSSSSPLTYTYAVFTSCKAYLERVLELLQWIGPATCIGVSLQVERATMPTNGQELEVWHIMLRTQLPNGGMAMVVSNLLSLMSFEAKLAFRTYCVGLTDIQCVWSAKEDPCLSALLPSGLPVISARVIGTPSWMPNR